MLVKSLQPLNFQNNGVDFSQEARPVSYQEIPLCLRDQSAADDISGYRGDQGGIGTSSTLQNK